jgi:SAM-dependent methyltransferase
MSKDSTEIDPVIKKALQNNQYIALDIGGGKNPEPNHINVDVRETPEVDIVAPAGDLPIPDGTVSRIYANSLIPHLNNPFEVFSEWTRVLEKGGEIVVKATHANSTGIRDDADHKLYSWTSETPEYFSGDMFQYYISDSSLELKEVDLVGWCRPYRWWLRPISWTFGKFINFVSNDMADEFMKLPLAGGRVTARYEKED